MESLHLKQTKKSKTCPLRSDCKRKSDNKFFTRLFERDWDYLVVKLEDSTGKFKALLECCGRQFDLKSNCHQVANEK